MSKLKYYNLKEFYLKNRLYINCVLLFSLYIFNCFFAQTSYIVYSILLVLILVDTIKYGSLYLIFNVPFCFLGQEIGLILFLVCALVFLVKAYIVSFVNNKLKFDKILLFLILILFLYVLLQFNRINSVTLINLSILILIILSFYLCILARENLDFSLILRVFAISILISAILGLFSFFSPYLKSFIVPFSLGENLIRYSALFTHPNMLAVLCEIALAFLTCKILIKSNILDIVLFVLVSLVGLSTFSKTFIIIFALILLTIFVRLMILNYKKTLLFSLPILFLVVIFFVIFPNLFTTIVNRFFTSTDGIDSVKDFLDTFTTGRFSLWVSYLSAIFSSPLYFFFGHGLGASTISNLGAHNTFITLFYQLGFIGFVLFAFIIGYLTYRAVKVYRFNKFALIPIIAITLLLFIEDLLFFA